jgi:predicted amidohydrolase
VRLAGGARAHPRARRLVRAGGRGDLVSYGSPAIVDRDGAVVRSAQRSSEDLLIAELDIGR